MWKLAVVQELIRGKDGLIRTAVVKTDTSVTNCPIVKLYPLELKEPKRDDGIRIYYLRCRAEESNT